jgi:hypothetical protein
VRIAAVMRIGAPVAAILATVLLSSCASPGAPASPVQADFLVDVAGERFVLRLTDPEAIRLAQRNQRGETTAFPFGTVKPGDGGFNQPWSWHLDPAGATFVELAMEVCDGRPSYLEAHLDEYPVYCPWGGRIVGRR